MEENNDLCFGSGGEKNLLLLLFFLSPPPPSKETNSKASGPSFLYLLCFAGRASACIIKLSGSVGWQSVIPMRCGQITET